MKIPRDMRPMARELRALGYLLEPGRGGHIHIRTGAGKYVFAMPSTTGDVKSRLALRTSLRRAGVPLT